MRYRSITKIMMAAAIALSGFAGSAVWAQHLDAKDVRIVSPGEDTTTRHVALVLNKSSIVELPVPAADVVITNPDIADAAVQTAKRMIFRGIQIGQTNAFVFDHAGNQILNLEIQVTPDIPLLNEMIARRVPSARVQAEAVGQEVTLSGFANSSLEVTQILQLTEAFTGREPLNFVAIDAADQVTLQVRIVELQRSVAKQLGVNLNGSTIIDDNLLLDFATANAASGGTGIANAGFVDGASSIGLSVSALERVGMLRTLAEPTITAISGETGNFLAGGEFPVPTGEAQDGGITIEFRPFGVGLSFTPFVLSEGRISLRVSSEVSELSTEGAINVGDISIPSLTTRRVETTVELGSGKSMMLAGLIQETTRQELSAVPGARNIPVLGALFQGRDYAHDETELVVLVTPILTGSASLDEFATPADGLVIPTDKETIFFSRLNRVYGRSGDEKEALKNYNAPVGFIEE